MAAPPAVGNAAITDPTNGPLCSTTTDAATTIEVVIATANATLTQDTVVTAHGGTARALTAFLGVAKPDEAAHHSVDHGVVYVFAGDQLKRYE